MRARPRTPARAAMAGSVMCRELYLDEVVPFAYTPTGGSSSCALHCKRGVRVLYGVKRNLSAIETILVTILENLVAPIKKRFGVDNAVSLAS